MKKIVLILFVLFSTKNTYSKVIKLKSTKKSRNDERVLDIKTNSKWRRVELDCASFIQYLTIFEIQWERKYQVTPEKCWALYRDLTEFQGTQCLDYSRQKFSILPSEKLFFSSKTIFFFEISRDAQEKHEFQRFH